MKELLWKRRGKFIQYLIASFMFVINHFLQIVACSLILGAIDPESGIQMKWVVLVGVGAVLFDSFNFLISRYLRIGYMRDTILTVRKQAFEKIMNLSFKKFNQQSKEVYLSHLVNDINTFEQDFFLSLLNFLISVGNFIISLLILIYIQPVLAAYMAAASVLVYLISSFFSKKTVQLQKQVSSENEDFTTKISNTFQGLEILELNRIDDKFLKKSLDEVKKVERRKFTYNIFAECQRNLINVLGYVITCGMMLYLCLNFQNGINLTSAAVAFQLGTTMTFDLIEAFPLFNKMKASVRIYEKITKEDEEEKKQGTKTEAFVMNQSIEVRDVSFAYGSKEILKHASFEIEKGKKYLIKGVSGAGKSTLMNLLAMTYDDYEGEILADGVSYRNIVDKTFHDQVAFVYQNVFLFEDTYRNNITLYKEVPEEKINAAIQACDLKELIDAQEHGLDQMLGENGKNLSGGQRQRISIARAIVKDAQILFVDEGTSSLNEELGREIEKVFLSLPQTVIAISHRYYEGVSEQYDYVLEIKNGKVIKSTAKEYFGEVIAC